MPNRSDKYVSTEVAILLTTCNKYSPGTQTFKLQSLVGLQENSTSTKSTTLSKANLLNKDPSKIPISIAQTSDTIQLDIPKEVVSTFPTKFIPPGTRFTVSFLSGDITKPVIVGREQ